MNIMFCTLVMLGQVLLYIGVSANNPTWMIFGRFVFGLGGESLSVTIGILLVSWFKGKELSFSQVISMFVSKFHSKCFKGIQSELCKSRERA